MEGSIPTLEDAIRQQNEALERLLQAATPAIGLAGQPMPPVNDRQVRVTRVPQMDFERIVGGTADGTVMRDQDTYVIFLSNPPRAAPFGLDGEEVERYYAWHEHEHISRGDVFHDYPETVYDRLISGQMLAAESEVTLAGARRYAVEARTRGAVAEADAIVDFFRL
ncbi:MAG: hypothetical protein IPM18_01125 [Phycisphaerales bacterium]|nr:hypothetical protein [Phycisphaerales bacterium]